MKQILLLLLTAFSLNMNAQGECLESYISEYYVFNNTSEIITIWVNNRDQENFPTEKPMVYDIDPGTKRRICELEWAQEFRAPNQWFIFKTDTKNLTPLCIDDNWIFNQISETVSEYTLTLELTKQDPCPAVDDDYFFTNHIMEAEVERLENEIYDFPEIEAKFPGGPDSLYKWMQNNIQYPFEAKEQGISGNVFVEFIIEKNGDLTNIKILRSPHELLSKESIRLIESMPNWIPAQNKNYLVRMRYRFPISFRLE